MKTLFKKALPHLIAVISFILISVAFYSPAISGKKLKMGDVKQWKGMSKEIVDFRNLTDEEPLWTNSMFGGMPAYQISVSDNGNLVKKLDNIYKLWLPRPIDVLFKAMLGFYILLMCMRVNPVIGAVSAISFGLSSFFILYLGAGHASKMISITYIAPMLGGLLYAFRRHALSGALIFAFFLCLHLAANHLQMTYYAIFLLTAVGLGEVIRMIVLHKGTELPKIIGIMAVAGILGAAPNYGSLATTAEYGEYSTRGSSDLTLTPPSGKMSTTTGEGLGKDYILEYSMSHGEWLGAYAPNIKGGRADLLVNVPEAKKVLSRDAQQFLGQNKILSYWGEQQGTAGAFYFGAFMFFLAICAFFLLRDSIRWPLLLVALLAVLASWKLGTVPDFFIEYVPLWNKFRDTKMMLMLLMIIIPFIAALFLNSFLTDQEYREKMKKPLLIIGGVFMVFNLFLISSPDSVFEFLSSPEKAAFSQLNDSPQGKKMLGEIVEGRQAIFTADVTRSMILFIIGFIILAVAFTKSELTKYAAFGLGMLFLGDMWNVNHRYFNGKDGFQSSKANEIPFSAENADKQILAREKNLIPDFDAKVDQAISSYKERTGEKRINDSRKLQRELEVLNQNTNYRVLNIGNPWSDARTSYYHKSIGGYHGAKLKIYQELTDFELGKETSSILSQLQSKGTFEGNFPILNMLNTKYMIGNPEGDVIPLSGALGNAWLVEKVRKTSGSNEEMAALASLDTKNETVIQEKYAEGLADTYSTDGNISLISYQPNELVYETNVSQKAFAVFSEIYYPAGWTVYVDGKETSHVKVNYVLRGLEIPAGAKEIRFSFEPSTYYTGRTISLASSVLLILLCLGMLVKSNMGVLKNLKD